MTSTKYFILLTFLTCASSFCIAQISDSIHLEKIVFHSSRCFGTCPQIDLEIDSNKNVYVSREYFKSRSETDTLFSGQFKGILQQDDYNKLIGILQNCNLDSLKFPDKTCCDGVITTIIIYFNGQRKYFKSMKPPDIAHNLISYLNTIGNNKELEKTNETKNIEK